MKYETPELTELTPAVNAIQANGTPKNSPAGPDSAGPKEHTTGYADWE